MRKIDDKELDVFVEVLSTEQGARAFLKDLLKTGFRIDKDPDKICHEDLVTICAKIITHIYTRESLKSNTQQYLQ